MDENTNKNDSFEAENITPELGEGTPEVEEKSSEKREVLSSMPDDQDSVLVSSERSGDSRTTSNSALLKWFLILGGGLVVLFYAVLLWGLLGGNIDNPLFKILGIGTGDLKETLLVLTHSIFGFLALIFLISTLVKVFQWIIIEKNAANRRNLLIRSGLHFSIFLGIFALWLMFFFLITNASIDPSANQFDDSMIVTIPDNTIGLTAPIRVEFDITEGLYKKIDQDLIRQISWDFDGDGVFDAAGTSVVYRFLDKGANNGRYNVAVTVDYFSPSADEEKSFTVTRDVIILNESVIANITADKESGPSPLSVEFSATGSRDPDGSIVFYEWDLDGDGEYEVFGEDQSVASKTFSQVGNFLVRLRVTGSSNDVSTVEKTIVVGDSNQNIVAEIFSDQGFEGVMPFEVTLDGGQSFSRFGDIISYEWFVEGEKEPVAGRTIKRDFRKPGEYEVSLTVENENGERHRAKRTIVVTDNQLGAVVDIRTQPPSNKGEVLRGFAPFEVNFDATRSTIQNPIEWKWDFEDDGRTDDFSPSARHMYREAGTYMARLTIVDSLEREYSSIKQVVVDPVGTQAKISASQLTGTVPLFVEFDGSASRTDDGDIVTYVWEFPNEDPFNYDAKVSYEFDSVGTFPVRLRVLTSTGDSAETEETVVVRAKSLQAEFEFSADRDNSLQYSFDPSESTGTIVRYQWDFGDGKTSDEVRPTHIYSLPGEYKASLKITNLKGLVSRRTKTIVIE